MKIVFCLCGSFCTFGRGIAELEKLAAAGHEIIPVMSFNAYETDTRFGSAAMFRERIVAAACREVIHTIAGAEPIGPVMKPDLTIIAPCTGNTLAKLAHSIADTPVTMAAKSHLRNGRPVVVAVSTNDALAGAAENIGKLLGRKNYYFVPFRQDDPMKKPTSMVADFEKIPETIESAHRGVQIQPILLGN